jgi:predicted enzyme related to lactoylglutathione lyase
LGIKTDRYGATFEWRQKENPERSGYTQLSSFPIDSDYFKPSTSGHMINFRVDDLEELLRKLESEGIHALGPIQVYDYGKFAHILDPEGNKIELWEPVDKVFDEMNSGQTNY